MFELWVRKYWKAGARTGSKTLIEIQNAEIPSPESLKSKPRIPEISKPDTQEPETLSRKKHASGLSKSSLQGTFCTHEVRFLPLLFLYYESLLHQSKTLGLLLPTALPKLIELVDTRQFDDSDPEF